MKKVRVDELKRALKLDVVEKSIGGINLFCFSIICWIFLSDSTGEKASFNEPLFKLTIDVP